MAESVLNSLRDWEQSTAPERRRNPTRRFSEEWSVSCELPPPEVFRCQVVELRDDSDEAVCSVAMTDHELPRVGFPAWLLKRKGLTVGSRFHWIVRDSEWIRLADIDTNVPQTDELSSKEKMELHRLYDEMEKGLAEDGGQWPIHSDGDVK